MQRWTELGQVPPGFGPSVVTIGNFDGVHLGHRQVLSRMVADARAAGIRAIAMTFDPHPLRLHRPDQAPELITGIRDRLELLAETGLDAVLVQQYTWEFARQSPAGFVRRYLVDGLRAATVVVGHDVRFGWQNAGDLSTMMDLGKEHGFTVEVIDDVSTPASCADGPRPGSANCWPPATSPAPRRSWAGRTGCAAPSSAATSAAATSGSRRPTSPPTARA